MSLRTRIFIKTTSGARVDVEEIAGWAPSGDGISIYLRANGSVYFFSAETPDEFEERLRSVRAGSWGRS